VRSNTRQRCVRTDRDTSTLLQLATQDRDKLDPMRPSRVLSMVGIGARWPVRPDLESGSRLERLTASEAG